MDVQNPKFVQYGSGHSFMDEATLVEGASNIAYLQAL